MYNCCGICHGRLTLSNLPRYRMFHGSSTSSTWRIGSNAMVAELSTCIICVAARKLAKGNQLSGAFETLCI